jgi:REP element-mobilizing transposase RayT
MRVEDGFYRRHLPHWQVDGAPHFITWRLEGALPAHMTAEFIRIDQQLDAAETGPLWLRQPQIAQLIVNALHYGERQLKLYELLAWVVMANHVHVVLYPRAKLAQITKAVKGYTALEANRMLERTGQFWQHESFDRWIRDRYELERIIRYVERNPVKAGLVKCEDDFRWSSAFPVPQASGLRKGQAGGLPYADAVTR